MNETKDGQSSDRRAGEHRAAKKLGITIQAMGDGFTWLSKDMDQTRSLAVEQWRNYKAALASGDDEVLILDEFTYPLHYGWVPVGEALDCLNQRPPMLHVIIIGRVAPDELVSYADLVTEMRVIKHPHRDQGIKAQPGIEF